MSHFTPSSKRSGAWKTCRTIISWWYKNKTTPDLSIVKRLGGSSDAKIRHLFGLRKDFEEKVCKVSAKKQVYLFLLSSRSHFYAKSVEMEVVYALFIFAYEFFSFSTTD